MTAISFNLSQSFIFQFVSKWNGDNFERDTSNEEFWV